MKNRARLLLFIICFLAGCATRPASSPEDPAIYRPTQPIHYPAPRE